MKLSLTFEELARILQKVNLISKSEEVVYIRRPTSNRYAIVIETRDSKEFTGEEVLE